VELLELADEATDPPSAYDYYRPVRIELIEADRTYCRLALQYHPDRSPSGQETMKALRAGTISVSLRPFECNRRVRGDPNLTAATVCEKSFFRWTILAIDISHLLGAYPIPI